MSMPMLAMNELASGGGVPIVLLHAFPLDSRMWTDVATHLPAHVRAIAIDLPGQGFSPLGTLGTSMQMTAEAVYQSLKSIGVANAIVVGCSWGGYVALALAERHPAFVVGLGLVDTKSTADTDEVKANRQNVAKTMERNSTIDPALAIFPGLFGKTTLDQRRPLIPKAEAWVHSQSPRGLAWAFRTIGGRMDRTEFLKYYSEPVAVIVGDEDRVTPLAEAENMVSAAKDATLTVIPGAGHLSPIETPELVAAALTALHRRVLRRSAPKGRPF